MRHKKQGVFVALVAAVFGLVSLIGLGTPAAALDYPYDVTVSGDGIETKKVENGGKEYLTGIEYKDSKKEEATFTIKNNGDKKMEVAIILNGGSFTLNKSTISIEANGSETFTLTFDPAGRDAAEYTTGLVVSPIYEYHGYKWAFNLAVKIDPKTVEVKSIDAIDRDATSTTNANDVMCTLDDGSKASMQELGLSSDGLTNNAVGSNTYAVSKGTSRNYNVTGSIPNLPVTVRSKAPTSGNSSSSSGSNSNGHQGTMPTQANPNLTVRGGTWTYDGNQHGASVARNGVGTYRVTYTKNGTSTTNPPKAAGTYAVHVELDQTPNYYSATADATITIRPRLISVTSNGDAVPDKVYDGTNKATVHTSALKLDGVVAGDDVALNPGKITATYGSSLVGNRLVTIELPQATLVGSDAANYALSNKLVNEYAYITQGSVSVTFHKNLTKEFGETYTFSPSDYTVSNGSKITLTSTGAPANATVGKHDISATGVGENYKVNVNNNAKLEVVQATPKLSKADAGSGQAGSLLSSVVPSVSYVNAKSGQAVPGTATWNNPSQTLGAAGSKTSYSYTFTPTDTVNYKSVTGEISVEATRQAPVAIAVNNTTATYDGLAHPVSVTTTPANASVKITYAGSTSAPTAAGTHAYKVEASASGYAANVVEGTLTISQASPTGQPKVSGSGSTLAGYTLDHSTIVGVNGKAVSGTIAWNDPANTAVKPGEKYGWTFTPSDKSYTTATGTIIPDPLVHVDTSGLQKAVAFATQLRSQAGVSANGQDVEPSKKWVTGDVDEFLVKAIESANSCLTEGGATQSMVDDALKTLNSAIDSYNKSMQPGLKNTGKVAVEKKASTITLVPAQVSLKPGDNPSVVNVGGEGNGELIAFSSNDDVTMATVENNKVVVSAISEGTALVTIARSATAEYEQAEVTLPVVVGEAPANYVPPTDSNNVEDEGLDFSDLPAAPVASESTVRVLNPYTGEHLFVGESEAATLISQGWQDEGSSLTPEHSNTPVYRLYNQWSGEHHYTDNKDEYDALVVAGWNGEDVAFYSDDAQTVPVYRLYNGYDGVGSHHYTADENEYQTLLAKGQWKDEGIGWHYVAKTA